MSWDKEAKAVNFELRFYSGYRGEETPRAVVIGSREFRIEKVISRKRAIDRITGKTFEVYRCRMEGEMVEIKQWESGEWEISFLEGS